MRARPGTMSKAQSSQCMNSSHTMIAFRQKPFWEQNSVDVESMKEWAKHPDVEIDHPISMFRQTLDSSG